MYQKLNNNKSKSATETTPSLAYKYLPAMKLMFRYLAVLITITLLVILGYKHLLMRSGGDASDDFDTNIRLMNILAEKTVTKKQSLINLNELNHMGDCLIREAGKVIVQLRREHNDQLNLNRKMKDNSIVTRADLTSHQIIVHTLNKKYPELRVVSEENGSQTNDMSFDPNIYLNKCDTYKANSEVDNYAQLKDIKVYIDPLDATQEYSENLIQYVTVMFCLVVQGKPKAGIIHNPFTNDTGIINPVIIESLFFFVIIICLYFNNKKIVASFLENRTLTMTSETSSSMSMKKAPKIIISRSHTGTAQSIIEKRLKGATLITAGGSGINYLSLSLSLSLDRISFIHLLILVRIRLQNAGSAARPS